MSKSSVTRHTSARPRPPAKHRPPLIPAPPLRPDRVRQLWMVTLGY